MAYSIKWSSRSLDELRKLPRIVSKRIINKLSLSEENPNRYLESLSGDHGYKIRVGDYRIIVDLLENEKIIPVRAIGHRKKVYKRNL